MLSGVCPICGRPAMGAGVTKCWRCQKRLQRGLDPRAELTGTLNALREAALAYAEAEEEIDYVRADHELVKACEDLMRSRGWRPRSAC